MKRIIVILACVIALVSCETSKKTTSATKTSTHNVTRKDEMKGGTSFENPIIIRVQTESAGVAEEYKWLSESYPGYSTIRKSQASKGNRHYDIITFRTRDGIEKSAYFDITSFFGK